MDKSDFKSDVLGHLRRTAIMALSTVEDGSSQVAYVLFIVDDDFNFYFATRSSTAKAKAIEKNNKVSLAAGIARPFNVQANGIAELITDQNETERILDEIGAVGGRLENFWPPLLHIGDSGYAVYKINTDWVRVLDLRSDIIHDPKSAFKVIKG